MGTNHYTLPQSSGAHYLSLQEAVGLGFGAYQTLRKYIAEGRLPAVKIGGRVKVLRADLDEVLNDGAVIDAARTLIRRLLEAARRTPFGRFHSPALVDRALSAIMPIGIETEE